MTDLSTDIAARSDDLRAGERPAAISRFVLALLGWGLMTASFAMWLGPTISGAPEVALMKLGLSVFMLIGGLCCVNSTRPLPQ